LLEAALGSLGLLGSSNSTARYPVALACQGRRAPWADCSGGQSCGSVTSQHLPTRSKRGRSLA
jgi:hypothetical protein